jgi:ABC-type glycerol-3-phosphate transport system permease component
VLLANLKGGELANLSSGSLIEVADMLMVLVVQTAPFEALLIPFFIMLRQLDLVWLSTFQTAFGTDWGGTMAASSLFTLPVVVFFLIIQRRLVSGLTAGAVKG